MAFKPDSEENVKKALEHARGRTQEYYGSSLYTTAVERYETRRDAYNMKNRTDKAAWRSKLHLATFFLSCKALDAQFKAAHSQDPFVFVSVNDNAAFDPDAEEKARLAGYDLMYDLKAGDFKPKLFDLYYYVEMFGTAVAREYIRSTQVKESRYGRNVDAYGYDLGGMEQERIRRKEHTCTQVIHPLNFAHDPHRRDFSMSEWGSVRFKLSVAEVYRMVDHPDYYQPGVKEAIKKIEAGEVGKIESETNHYYEDNSGKTIGGDMLVVEEYSGPMRFKGNRGDLGLYYALYIPGWNLMLRVGPSPFRRHPYWKMQTYPYPHSPYGVGPNDPVLPINWWENDTVNRFNDWMAVVSKFLYMAKQDHIIGGFPMLYDGLPLGIVPVERGAKFSDVIAPVPTDYNAVNLAAQAMELIEKYKQQQGMTSNLRGKESQQLNDTATGISLIAQREDEMVAALQASCDLGIEDGMQLKLQYRHEYFELDEMTARMDDGTTVEYMPKELRGMDWAFEINRKLPDQEIGKHMNYLKLLGFLDNKLQQSGQPLPAEFVIDEIRNTAQAMNIRGADEAIRKLKDMLASAPVQVPGAGAPPSGPGQPAPGGMGGGAPQGAPPKLPPVPESVKAGEAQLAAAMA